MCSSESIWLPWDRYTSPKPFLPGGVQQLQQGHLASLILSLLLLFFRPSQSLSQDQLVERTAAEDRSVLHFPAFVPKQKGFVNRKLGFFFLSGLGSVFLVAIKSACVCVCVYVLQRMSAARVGGRGGEHARQCSGCSDCIRQRGRWEESMRTFGRAVRLRLPSSECDSGPPTHTRSFSPAESKQQSSSTGAPALSNSSSPQPQPSTTQPSMTSEPSQLEDSAARGEPLPPSGKNKRELVSN